MRWATLGIAVSACSSGSSGSGGAGQPDASSLSLAQFCEEFTDANAALLSRCLGGEANTWAMEVPPQYSCASLESAVKAGRVTYASAEAAACIAAYPSLSCSDFLIGPSVCSAPLSGTAESGAACFADGDCSGSNYCKGVGNGNSACQGKCAPLLAAGSACTMTEECVVGYTCSGEPPNLTCISERHPIASLGGSCAPVAPTGPAILCGPGLRCNRQTLTCATTANEGDACTPGEGMCVTFTYCDSSSKSCRPDPGSGGMCGSTPAGELMTCLPGLYCKLPSDISPIGTCVPLGGPGAACSGNFECASDSCDSQTGECSTPCTEE
jgi:hypothetical protein